LAVERDRDVSEALEGVLAGLRPRPADPPPPPPAEPRTAAPPPPPPPPPQTASASSPGPAEPPTAAVPLALDNRQAQIAKRLGLSPGALSAAGGPLLAERAKALARSNYFMWLAIGLFLFVAVPGLSVGVRSRTDTDSRAQVAIVAAFLLATAISGLAARALPPPAMPLTEIDTKIVKGVPIVRFFQVRFEARLFRGACLMMLVGGIFGAAMVWIAAGATSTVSEGIVGSVVVALLVVGILRAIVSLLASWWRRQRSRSL